MNRTSDILTLEQISDVDTFTLQQKVQQLERLPLSQAYQQLITFAKAELSQRYKVQQFGRMLINDEIPILPQLTFKIFGQRCMKKQLSKQSTKLQLIQCLKRSALPNGNGVTIGKSTVGNYQPSQKQKNTCLLTEMNKKNKKQCVNLNTKIVARQTVPMKNNNTDRPKLVGLQTNGRANTMTKFGNNVKCYKKASTVQGQIQKIQQFATTECTQRKQKSLSNKLLNNNLKQENFQTQKQLIKIDKQKEKPTIKYIENDVYDVQKLVLDTPQKLSDIKLEVQTLSCDNQQKEEKDPTTQIQLKDQEIQNNKKNQSIRSIEQKQQQSLYDIYKKQQKVRQKQQKEQRAKKIDEIRLYCQSEIQYINDKAQFQKDIVNLQSQQIANCNNSNVETQPKITVEETTQFVEAQKQEEKQPTIQKVEEKEVNKAKSISFPHKHIGNTSCSLKVMPLDKKQYTSVRGKMDIVVIEPIKFRLNKPQSQKVRVTSKTMTNFTKHYNKISHSSRNCETVIEMQRPLFIESNTYDYQQIIPTFNKLFPHSQSLLNTLRQVQKQLTDHINKKINKLSLNDQYLKIRQQQLFLKAIIETGKAKKYQSIFDINLDSFIERGQIMMDRINKQFKDIKQQEILLYRVVRQKQDVYDIVNSSFHRTEKWFELPHGMDLRTSWNLLWTWSRPQIDIKELFYFQKINHFFGSKELARKDLLKKNIQRIKKLGNKAKSSFDIIPQTYFLPGQNMQFVRKFQEYSMQPQLNYWIMKPVGLSRGRGIELVTRIEDIVFNQPVVLQKYLANPLLLDGHKFDMRIYAVVLSINPLEAYVYKEGFARISTKKYSLEKQDLGNKFIHLTNFSVQKQNLENEVYGKKDFVLSSFERQIGGCKITLKSLKQKLAKQQIKWQQIQSQIDGIILKSLVSTMNVIDQNPNCFQLFGYDIIIDENLRCWLIQVNSSPSLEKDFTIDQIVKQQLVDDIISVVDPIPYDRGRLLQVVSRRRKELQGLKSHINTQNNSAAQLNYDLHYILHGRHLRKYGQGSENKNFRKLAPGNIYSKILKTVQQYKLTSIIKQQNC